MADARAAVPRPAAAWQDWVAGARPRTLPAAVVPVLVGTACATGRVDIIAWRAIAAGIVALALQVGTNYANDYSDGVRGTDSGERRLTSEPEATGWQKFKVWFLGLLPIDSQL